MASHDSYDEDKKPSDNDDWPWLKIWLEVMCWIIMPFFMLMRFCANNTEDSDILDLMILLALPISIVQIAYWFVWCNLGTVFNLR